MIIKIIPTKTPSRLKTVLQYIATDKGRIDNFKQQSIFHNVSGFNLESINEEIQSNYQRYARKRKDGNLALHVIVSMNPMDKDKLSLMRMDEIMNEFIDKAYREALVFATHHLDVSHFHSHAVVSSNRYMSNKSTRLSKSRLYEVQSQMIDFVNEWLGIEKPRFQSNWGKKLTNEATYYAHKRNPGIKLDKETLTLRVNDIFRRSNSSKEFFDLLDKEGYLSYNHKDRRMGIMYGSESRKMRFSRLGITDEHFKQLDMQNERLLELEDIQLTSPIQLDHYQREELIDQFGGPGPTNQSINFGELDEVIPNFAKADLEDRLTNTELIKKPVEFERII